MAISVNNLSHSFGALEVLDHLTLEVGAGEVLGVVGPSGSGKTTLLELLAGLEDPEPLQEAGSDRSEDQREEAAPVSIGGVSSSEGRLARCAYMPQRDLLLPWLRAIDNAAIALRNRGLGRDDSRATAAPLFERFGLAGFENAHPEELSGGMRQRVAFLRTLLAGKPVLLLDEPFGALDAITRGEMQEWLGQMLESEPRTVVLVTHDVEEALYLCDRVLVLGTRPATLIAAVRAPNPRSAPRIEAITDPGFIAVRESALAGLGVGAARGAGPRHAEAGGRRDREPGAPE